MDPFELSTTQAQVDEKLKDLEDNGHIITQEIKRQATKRKLQIKSSEGRLILLSLLLLCFVLSIKKKG